MKCLFEKETRVFHVRDKQLIDEFKQFCELLSLHDDKGIVPVFSWSFRKFQIVRDAQTLSARMNHRGACACDNDTGDGAGVLCAIPHDYYANEIR